MQNLTDEVISPLHGQEAFRLMFEQAGFGVAQVSLQGQWLAVNQSLCDILGFSRPELLSRTLREVTRFDDVGIELADCHRLLENQIQSFSSEKRHLRGDGRVAWLKATVTLVRDDVSGEPASYLAIIEDLTPHKKEVRQIQVDGDKRLRVLTDNISDIFFTLDQDLRCISWNKAAEILTGVAAADALGKVVGEIFRAGADGARAETIYREVLALQQIRSFTGPHTIGEKEFLLEVTAYPSNDGISVVAMDIGERRKSAEMRQRLAAIVESSDDAICSVTPEGRIASWNRGAEKLFGYSAADVLGKDATLLVPPHLLGEGNALWQDGLKGKGIQGHETQRLRKDGTGVEVSISISPVVSAHGSITGLSLIARDIFERKRNESALKRQSRFNEIMTRILTRFTTCGLAEVNFSVLEALQQTAEFLGVDHAYVLIFSPDRTTWTATHEWCAPNVQRQTSNYQNVPFGSMPWSESRLLAGEDIRINTAEDYPPEATVERQLADMQAGMQSILLVPIFGAAGVIAGTVGFDSHARQVTWSDDDVAYCKMVGDAIATVQERKRAEEALRNSEEKFSKAFEASPAMITIIRVKDRRYLEVNRAFEQHTGFPRTQVLGRSIAEVGQGPELGSLNQAFEKVLELGSVRNLEARLCTKSGDSLIALLSAELVEFDGQTCVLTVAEDISERKLAEDALRESEERFRAMADSAPILMWMAGPDKGCTDFNRGWLEFTGRTLQQESGDGWAAGVHPADLSRCIDIYHAAFDQRQPFAMEYRLRRHDGEYRWLADTGTPRFLHDGSFVGYIGCCLDVDDQKRAEMERTDLSRRLMTAQEAERTRIARELHDGIGQSLALLGIQMQRASQPIALRLGKKNPGMQELCAKLKDIGNQVSQLSHRLHSSELEFLGLAVAVKSLCREFSEQYHLKVECACHDIPADLDNEIALCFVRICQEALHNVAKHSHASVVWVELSGIGNELTLAILDDGVGFEMNQARKTAGLGMVSMRERMHLIGGEFTISSKPGGGGTKLQAKAPLAGGSR
jgi:PAS domain S-box-containing protein